MPTKYIWFDDKRKDPPTRMELRPPASLRSFVQDIADRNGVSVNAFVVALMEWAVTADEGSKLRIDVRASRCCLTAEKPVSVPVQFPSQVTSHATRKRYEKPKVR